MTRSALSYQKWPIIVTVIGLTLSGWLGWVTTGTLSGLISFLIIGGILAALEIALSFDNAIVNANKLVEMTPIWQRRFHLGNPNRCIRYAHNFSTCYRCNICMD